MSGQVLHYIDISTVKNSFGILFVKNKWSKSRIYFYKKVDTWR